MMERAIYVIPGVVDEAKARADAERMSRGDVRNEGIEVTVHHHRVDDKCNARCKVYTKEEVAWPCRSCSTSTTTGKL